MWVPKYVSFRMSEVDAGWAGAGRTTDEDLLDQTHVGRVPVRVSNVQAGKECFRHVLSL